MNKLFNIIAAMDFNHGIGYKGKLPWDIKGDLKFFKEITKTSPLIMGRKTWESLPVKPLPNRENIVISKKSKMNSLQKALDYCWDKNQNPFIIGGSSIYEEAINHQSLDGLFLTLIHGSYKSDVFFPQIPENLKIMFADHYLNYSMFTFIKKSIS
jgi:dihydrofolate reductase